MEPIRITTAMKQSLEARRAELDTRIHTLKQQLEGADSPDEYALLDQLTRERHQIAGALEQATLIDEEPFDTEAIEIGDTITIREDGGAAERYVLVDGTFGTRVHEDWVSASSPLGAALVGRSKGDKVIVETPGGVTPYTILAFERGSHKGTEPRSRSESSAKSG
jgi:transcription elongation factor GreA